MTSDSDADDTVDALVDGVGEITRRLEVHFPGAGRGRLVRALAGTVISGRNTGPDRVL